jgi:hypothetical protein
MASSNLLDKMHWKDGQDLLLVNPPESLIELFDVDRKISHELTNQDFIIIFLKNSEEVRNYSESFKTLDLGKNVLWVAYPKKSSPIPSDLSRDSLWNLLRGVGLTGVSQRSLNDDWSVIRFKAEGAVKHSVKGSLDVPPELIELLQGDEAARGFFYGLSATNRKEYIQWITGAKKAETRERRLSQMLDRLNAGLKNPSERLS